MLFSPQKYKIVDTRFEPFIDESEIRKVLDGVQTPSVESVREVVERSLNLERLSMEDTAVLLRAEGTQARQVVLDAAGELKKRVYGERIVLFAPLYIGNRCINNCTYCGFRAANKEAVRMTLSDKQITAEVKALEGSGQKRLILVYGEHPEYSPEYIAHTVKLTYGIKSDGSINRVNINAAPFDVDGFRTIKEAAIGTYQIFQESYDREVYAKFHPSGRKADYDYRLTSLDRAMEAGIDDVGLGVLLGLGDWRFEVMALVRHTNHLEACFGVGPHTISFPRIKNASNLDNSTLSPVSDADFAYIIAVLRLAVPYAGLILTAREPHELRDRLIKYGVSQIDAGTRLELGGYSEKEGRQDLHREQFEIADTRTLHDTIEELVANGQIPSFCTACYRKGRTGEHFMEFSTKGHIKEYCTINALLTFAEYLEDFADESLKESGWQLIAEKVAAIKSKQQESVANLLERIRSGERDILL